jgi:hypothetical protein
VKPYHHRQVGYFMIAALLIGLGVILVALSREGFNWIGAAVLLLIVAALINYWSLTVTIDDDNLEVRFGPGLIRRTYRLADVDACSVVRNKPYYGWGTRYTPHGWLYSVSGLDAVELVLRSGKAVRIGTDEPERLATALTQATLRRPSAR